METKVAKRKRGSAKMSKDRRKERIKLAKNSVDYDWLDLHQYVCKSILHMCEYYEDGENVAQCEEERLKTLNSLLKAKEMITEFDKHNEEYYERLNARKYSKNIFPFRVSTCNFWSTFAILCNY